MATSLITRGANTFESLTKRSRPKVTINLSNQSEGFVASYTTFDKIEGEVIITVEQETPFYTIDIGFEGISRTSVERPASAGHTTSRPSAFHNFLKLRQPIHESTYPEARVFKPGQPYKIPFTFVVPEQLLPSACTHSVHNVHVRHAHTQLPPSFGDPIVASDGTTLLDDLAPHMSQISYFIRVNVTKKPTSHNNKLRTLVAVAHKIRIIPASVEQPPLDVPENSEDYCIRREKDVRRGLLRGKMGRLVVACSQPKPFELPPPGSEADPPAPVTSAVTLHIRFDPEDEELPPRLGSLIRKLKCTTFFATTPWSQFPSKTNAIGWHTLRGAYAENISLSSMCVASAQWERHESEDKTRRGSVQSTSTTNSQTGPTASYNDRHFYTASIIVPLSLPTGKAFLPTFHSCLISRVYTLDLSLSYHTPKSNVVAPSASLKVPIQITCAFRENAIENLLNVEFTQTQVEDQFFRSRGGEPPIPGYDGIISRRDLHFATSLEPYYGDDDDLPEYSSLPHASRPRDRLGIITNSADLFVTTPYRFAIA